VTEDQQRNTFKRWLDQNKSTIFKIVRAYASNPMDRDDLFQEITVHIWNSIPRFKEQSSPGTWIYRIALNTVLKWVRKSRKVQTSLSLENYEPVLEEYNTELDERLKWLYSEIYSLDLIDRCLVLLMLDDFSYKEMATVLGITESGVGVKINRIKKRLTLKSKEYDYGI
jgi:RNA polymerase sigma-70 factor (ECF subfamily)